MLDVGTAGPYSIPVYGVATSDMNLTRGKSVTVASLVQCLCLRESPYFGVLWDTRHPRSLDFGSSEGGQSRSSEMCLDTRISFSNFQSQVMSLPALRQKPEGRGFDS